MRSRAQGGSNSVVESQPSKLLVAGSIPVSRSTSLAGWCSAAVRSDTRSPKSLPPAALPQRARALKADVAQLAEHVLGKDEVTSSILVIGSSLRRE